MMLRYSFSLEGEARMIEAAVDATLAAGHRTPDIAGPSDTAISTSEMGSLIACAVT
jgi:3-isopropylmalate dehydrogenase